MLALAREAKLDKEAKGLGTVLVTELLVRAVGSGALIVAPKLLLADKHNWALSEVILLVLAWE